MADDLNRLTAALADRYRIERELGAGGMATVYLAEDLKHKRKVAVKVLRPELAAVLGAERFVQEITTTANLQHPHILALFDSGEADGFLYYVMPYIEGETLRAKLDRETQLGVDDAVRITCDVADALEYAHRQGVIHRDIKPENILLHNGRPMVADFGIALAVSAAAGGRLTETGLSLGTPHYMSPEQATADKDLTNRSDIYSVGAVLYEMLTGDPPHTGSSAQQIIMKIVTDEARPVTELRKSAPPNVGAAVAKSLEKLPADRFASSAEFAAALLNPAFATATGGGTTALHHGSPVRRPALTTVLSVTTVLALALAASALLRTPPRPPVARYSIALPEGQEIGGLWARLTLTPDGSQLIYSSGQGLQRSLWVRHRDRLEAAELAGTAGAWAPFVSPDGKNVGFYVAGAVHAVPVRGGPPAIIVDTLVGGSTASWGSDGFIYFDHAGAGPIMRVQESGGIPEQLTTLDTAAGERDHISPAVLPNGRGVLFSTSRSTRPDEDAAVAVAETATGRHRVLVEGAFAPLYVKAGYLLYITTTDGTLMAVRFDQDALEISGEAVEMVSGVGWRTRLPPDIAVADDGTLVYTTGRSSGRTGAPVWVTRDGRVEPVALDWTESATDVAISPDGTELAVVIEERGESNIWVRRRDGTASQLTFAGTRNGWPTWIMDGRSIAFLSDRGANNDVYVRRSDGTGGAELLLDLAEAAQDIQLSPNGEWAIYELGIGNSADLFARRTRGDTTQIPVAVSPFKESEPAISPDGRWVAYRSGEAGDADVFVRPFPDVMGGKWRVSVTGGLEPVWAPDGSELFYVNSDFELVAVEIRPDRTPPLGQQRVLFSVAGYLVGRAYGAGTILRYDVAPGADRFALLRPSIQESGRLELIVVQNFVEELRAKVGN